MEIAAVRRDVPAEERRDAGEVLVEDGVSGGTELGDDVLDVDCSLFAGEPASPLPYALVRIDASAGSTVLSGVGIRRPNLASGAPVPRCVPRGRAGWLRPAA